MKKLFGAICLMLLAAGAQAQDEAGTWSLIPHIGISSAKLTNMPNIPLAYDIALKKDFLPGLEAGVEASYRLTDRIGLSAGLDYSVQGGKWKDFAMSGIEIKNTRMVIGYLQVPVMASFYLLDGLALKTGVQFGVPIHANMKTEMSVKADGIPPYSESYNSGIMDDINKLDISIPIGVSFEFDNNLVLEARYKLGLTKVEKEDEDGRGHIRNRVFCLSIGYKFTL